MLQSICREADEEIERFLEAHRGFRLNPLAWGRQAAYYREFEQLRDELELARRGGDLSQVALIVVMIVEDEQRFVRHLHEAIRTHDELHQRLSAELRKSSDQLQSEAHTLSGWAAQENQRLQSTVSHQLIQHLEKWQSTAPEPQRASVKISEWIAELAKLRDQDPELAVQAA
jgi:restriction endonuclease